MAEDVPVDVGFYETQPIRSPHPLLQHNPSLPGYSVHFVATFELIVQYGHICGMANAPIHQSTTDERWSAVSECRSLVCLQSSADYSHSRSGEMTSKAVSCY